MRTTTPIRFIFSIRLPKASSVLSGFILFLIALTLLTTPANAEILKVMKMGLGSGKIESNVGGIDCGATCNDDYAPATPATQVTLTATPEGAPTPAEPDLVESLFDGWEGDCSGMGACVVTMDGPRSVRAKFKLKTAINKLTKCSTVPATNKCTPTDIKDYFDDTDNDAVTTPAHFINALPDEYKLNWILMTRSESLQTGTAESPRILLPSKNAQFVFSIGAGAHSSYPASHPNAIEYMQWDADEKNFRFHEIVLDDIDPMDFDNDGVAEIPLRTRGISKDDIKCSKCHSTQNVSNISDFPGTMPVTPGNTQAKEDAKKKAKNKPNWDAYDSWGGMLPFNRDRIYQGTVEAAAFRKIFNLWTWRTNRPVRSIIEQLELQPSGVSSDDVISRTSGGANDAHINFAFDGTPLPDPPVTTEPAPVSTPSIDISTKYKFDAQPGPAAEPVTTVKRQETFVTLNHSEIVGSDEGRGVRFFDALGGLRPSSTQFNQKRIADELIKHKYATGSVSIDVRPIALAIAKNCVTLTKPGHDLASSPALAVDFSFFNSRNGINSGNLTSTNIDALVTDTKNRQKTLPRRKADIQRMNLDRKSPGGGNDPYLIGGTNGLIQEYGSNTDNSQGTSIDMERLRQEVFRRRTTTTFRPDQTAEMLGIAVDREDYYIPVTATNRLNAEKMAMYRYFLEPLGVAVDKWSMGVRGRSRTYAFADVFSTYTSRIRSELQTDLTNNFPRGSGTNFNPTCTNLINAVNSTLSDAALPADEAPPTYTDVQRIFNKSCIECHGALRYPPYSVGPIDLSEDESPTSGNRLMTRSYNTAITYTAPFASDGTGGGRIYDRINRTSENCFSGVMPCGGPALSKVDIETIRRWINGGRIYSEGDPHIRTIDGIHYDFQAAGEFILLTGESMELQARQTAIETNAPLHNNYTGLTTSVSINTAAALRIAGHRITYQPNISGEPDPSGMQLRIDGKLTQMNPGGIPLANGGRIMPTSAPGGIQIEAPGGTVVVLTPGWWSYYEVWWLSINVRHARATQGIMGAIHPGNWLPALPDGSLLGPKPRSLPNRHKALYEVFGNAWRVNKGNTLFDYGPGTSTDTFTIAECPSEDPHLCTQPDEPGEITAKPPQPVIEEPIAEQHCANIVDDHRKDNCVKDVMVTGEVGFAQHYLLIQQIELHKPPTAPVLESPEDGKTGLVKPVKFTWGKTTDEDGNNVTYRHCVWKTDAIPNDNLCQAVPIDTSTTGGGSTTGGSNTGQMTPGDSGERFPLSMILLGFLMFLILLIIGVRNKSGLLILLAIVILVAVILAYYYSGDNGTVSKPVTKPIPKPATNTVTKTVTGLESGKSYFWKVIAEDSKGGVAESQTRRFEVK